MKVCLVTTGQPSTTPRLVKEADALAASGYEVHVVAAHWADWATKMDGELLASRSWGMTFIDWRLEHAPLLFSYTRVRHWAARKATWLYPMNGEVTVAALSRVGPDLRNAALKVKADLYIAHNLGALPAAVAAATAHSSRFGFDAEDFHSGQLSSSSGPEARLTRDAEIRFLARSTYVTAASPGIAEAYRDLCGIPLPTCILNVFPLKQRPDRFRLASTHDPVRLYWFSQTIGPNRGLEDAVRAMGLLNHHVLELHLRGSWARGYEAFLRKLAAESGVDQNRIVSHEPTLSDEMIRQASSYDIGLAIEPSALRSTTILLFRTRSSRIF